MCAYTLFKIFYFETRDRKFHPTLVGSRTFRLVADFASRNFIRDEISEDMDEQDEDLGESRGRFVFLFMLLFTQLLLWPASCCPFPAQSSRSWAGPTGPNRVRKCPKSYTCLSLRREVWPPVQFRSRLVWLGGSSVYFAFNPSAFHLGRVLVSLTLKLKACRQLTRLSAGFMTQCRSIISLLV